VNGSDTDRIARLLPALYNKRMAKNLTDKLNTLIRSRVQGAINDLNPRRRDQPLKLGKHIDRDVAALRQQINQALDEEDQMTAEIGALQRQAADWDQQADRALTRGDEAAARHAVRQMQLVQQRQTMLEADLAQHRYSTSELISRVNELEARVAEARQTPKDDVKPEDASEESLSARLSRTRQEAVPQPPGAKPEAVVDEQAVEDDLARRRARLSQ
jgi:phage shock protein A